MVCWICGNEGDSGEHLIKASDIKGMFSDISQNNPIFYHNSEKRNIPVGSAKSDRFKSDALICRDCNNNKTSSHDHAWQKLSEHLRKYPLHKRGSLRIRFNKVFKQYIYLNSVYVHLFFVKLFGCRIIGENIKINTDSFSRAILTNKLNPFVFIRFRKSFGGNPNTLAITPIHLELIGQESEVVAWMYTVGELNVEILYSQKSAHNSFLKQSFHPHCMNRVIEFMDFEVDNDEM